MLQDENKIELESILSKLTSLESRMVRIEEELGIDSGIYSSSEKAGIDGTNKDSAKEEDGFESRIGGYGLALLGNIVFLFGLIFVSNYIQGSGYPALSGIFGYACVAGIFILSRFAKKRIPYLSTMFEMVGFIMVYYATMRLHFFSANPLISNTYVSCLLLFIVLLSLCYYTVRKRSELFAVTVLVLVLVSGVISNSNDILLGSAVLASAVSVYFFFKYNWKSALLSSIFMVYLIFVIWFMDNQQAIAAKNAALQNNYCYIYLFACAVTFSLTCLVRAREKLTTFYLMTAVLLNGIMFSCLLLLFVPALYSGIFTMLFIAISIFCMIYSILLKYFSDWKFAKAFYAMYGFVAISISVYGIFKFPFTYLLLTLQSLYVISIAIWFRSKLMISMNTILFLALLIVYFISGDIRDSINFSFAATAFISASIIDWRKKYLEIEANLLRNVYLATAFCSTLFALYKALPAQFITLSWTVLAIVYFLYSMIFKNVRYRWMAIITMIAAAFYLFLFDLSRISIVFRIVAFLFLAIISISISLYYNRPKKDADSNKNAEEE